MTMDLFRMTLILVQYIVSAEIFEEQREVCKIQPHFSELVLIDGFAVRKGLQ